MELKYLFPLLTSLVCGNAIAANGIALNQLDLTLGLGYASHNFNDVQLNNYTAKAQAGFTLEGSVILPVKDNITAEIGLTFNSTKQGLPDGGLCKTNTGGYIGCNLEISNRVVSIPVSFNYNKPFLIKGLTAYVGVGGALSYVSRNLQYAASGYSSSTVTNQSTFSVSPYAQAGLRYNHWRFNAGILTNVGNDSTGTGSVPTLGIDYVF